MFCSVRDSLPLAQSCSQTLSFSRHFLCAFQSECYQFLQLCYFIYFICRVSTQWYRLIDCLWLGGEWVQWECNLFSMMEMILMILLITMNTKSITKFNSQMDCCYQSSEGVTELCLSMQTSFFYRKRSIACTVNGKKENLYSIIKMLFNYLYT